MYRGLSSGILVLLAPINRKGTAGFHPAAGRQTGIRELPDGSADSGILSAAG